MIDLELEQPTLSRSARRSGLSFAVSCVFHLSLFVALTWIVWGSPSPGVIELTAQSVDQSHDLFDALPTRIEVDSNPNVLELAPELREEMLPRDPLETIDPAVDWSEALGKRHGLEMEQPDLGAMLHAATQGGFFGIEATGNRIVYVIDRSPSMGLNMATPSLGYQQRRFDRAIEEVLSSVDQLKPDQHFFVIMFSYQKLELKLPGFKGYYPPTDEVKAALRKRLSSLELSPGTDPRMSLVTALKLRPSCCFLLSDGEFNGKRDNVKPFGRRVSAVELAEKHNLSGCPIHTVGLADRGSQADMTQIAENSMGVYTFIPAGEGANANN